MWAFIRDSIILVEHFLFVCSADMYKPKLLCTSDMAWVFCTDSSLKINWVQSKMDCQLVMYLKSDCSKWE